MSKKRTFSKVINEIFNDIKGAEESQWKKLFSLAKNFHHFQEGYIAARGDNPKWEKKFLEKMIKSAVKPAHWFFIAQSSKEGTPPWNVAVEKLLQNAREGESIENRWREVGAILPKNHPLMKEVKTRLSAIRNIKKNS